MKAFLVLASTVGLFAIGAMSASADTAPTAKTFDYSFRGDPACVVQGMNARFPLFIENTGTTPLFFTINIEGVQVGKLDYGVQITSGTDHLTGGAGKPYWSFTLQPGQSTAKHLMVRVEHEYELSGGPDPYQLDEQILVANSPATAITPFYSSIIMATPPFCGEPVQVGGMK